MRPELFITRHNELVDPIVSVWNWQIPVYLFLGGWVAGMMVITGYAFLKERHRGQRCVCSALPGVGLVLLSLGMLALFLDLEHKRYVWRLYTTFEPSSPMSWGAWILLLVYPVLVLMWLVRPPALLEDVSQRVERASRWLQARPGRVRAVGGVGIGLGVALGIYTGILLSALGARPLWSSAILGPLFLVSGLSAAAAFAHMVARNAVEREDMAHLDNVMLPVELALLTLFLLGLLTGSAPQVEAAALFLGGPYTAAFWVLVVGLGIVMPFAIQMLAVRRRIAHSPIAPLLVLAGGLALRFVFVGAGQLSHWAHGAMRIH
jgi:formate-dependent nitrite reductase membrane component NrfD